MNTTLATITEAIGWTLIHFLWQGAAIALAFVILCTLLKNSWRYGIAALCLFSMLGCAIVTFSSEMRSTSTPGTPIASTHHPAALPVAINADSPAPNPVPSVTVPMEPVADKAPLEKTALDPASSWLPYLVALWAIGLAICSLRLFLSWRSAHKLRRDSTPISGHPINAGFIRLVARLRISTPVRLLSSATAKVPMVIGAFRPAIILPARLLTGFDSQQLEAIVAHELAHVRRRDYLVNLLQNLLEAMFFYHPAVWWISSQMRQEREHCCDDIAVQVTGGTLVYGRALAALEQELGDSGPLAAGVAANGGSLLRRIQRLTGSPQPQRSPWPALLLCSATAVAVALSLLVNAGAQDDPAKPKSGDDGFPNELPVAALPDELSRSLSWGKKNKSGLAAAISLDPRKASYTVGATLQREYLIANFGSKATGFTVGHWLQDEYVRTEAHDWDGEKLDLATINDSGVTLLIDVKLAPGEFVRVPAPPVFLKPIPAGEGVSPSGAYIGVDAGDNVRLTGSVELEGIGRLPTGATEFKIVAAAPIKVSGTIVDDASGEAVTDFVIQAGRIDKDKPGGVTWGFSETRGGGKEGKFRTQVRWHQGWTARVIADGYLPHPILTEVPADGSDRIAVSDASFDAWPVAIPEDPEEEIVIRLPQAASVTLEYDIDGGFEEDVVFYQSLRHRDPLWKGLEVIGNVPIKNGNKITIEGLAPGPYQFARTKTIRLKVIGMGMFRDRSFIDLKPGESKAISYVRKTGTRVAGKVVAPAGVEISGTIITVRATEKTIDPVDGNDWLIDYAGEAAGEDGSFETERVPPGKYKLIAEAYVAPKPTDGFRSGRMGPAYTAEVEIEVPEKGGPTQVPPLTLKKAQWR